MFYHNLKDKATRGETKHGGKQSQEGTGLPLEKAEHRETQAWRARAGGKNTQRTCVCV